MQQPATADSGGYISIDMVHSNLWNQGRVRTFAREDSLSNRFRKSQADPSLLHLESAKNSWKMNVWRSSGLSKHIVNVTPFRIGNLCGILAPLLWAFAIILCGDLRPEYSYFTQYISELGERGSSTELIMRYAGFVPTGLMHIAFAAFLYFALRGGRLEVIAAMLIGVNGLARIGAGLFPCEPGCVSPEMLLSQRLHSLCASIGFFALIGASVVWGFLMRRHQGLRGLSLFSLGCSALGLAFLLLMVWSDALRAGTGLYERLSSGALSLWVFVFAARMWRLRG